MYATSGVPVHSVVVVVVVVVVVAAAAAAAAAELVPFAGLLAARCSVGLHFVLVLMALGPELGPEPEPGCDVAAARRTFVVVPVPALLPMLDVHRLSDFDLELVPPALPCKTAYWALHKLAVSIVEGMHDGVARFGVGVGAGVGAEVALAEAGQRAVRVDVENYWTPYCRRLPSRAKRAKAQHGETKLRH